MSKAYEYEVVFRVTMTEPMQAAIPDPSDRTIANITNASTRCVMEIKEVNNLVHGSGPWHNGQQSR